MAKQSGSEFGYSVSREEGRDYVHVEVSLYSLSGYGSNDCLCSFRWQATQECARARGDMVCWYGATVSVQSCSMETLRAGTSLAARLLPEMCYDTRPEDLLAACAKRHIARCVYDSRVDARVLVSEMLPGDVQRWMDDYRRLGNSCVKAEAFCATEDEARAIILGKLASDLPALQAFVAAGCPVFVSEWDVAPRVQSLDVLLAVPGAAVTEGVAA